MSTWQPIELSRDCSATTVPHGVTVELNAGGLVSIVQQLGSSITVQTEMGTLLRIDGHDADALGIEMDLDTTTTDGTTDRPFEMAAVTEALQGIYDPEIPVSIVELGLVYRCEEVMTDDNLRRIEIDMTMTAPGCGMGDVLRNDALRAVGAVAGVDDVVVDIVWSPRWGVDRMSEGARLQLGLL